MSREVDATGKEQLVSDANVCLLTKQKMKKMNKR